jgi:hypothetical protein
VVGDETSEGFRGMESQAGYDLQRVERHRTLPSRFQHVIFLADGSPQRYFPLISFRLFRCPLTFAILKRVFLPGFVCPTQVWPVRIPRSVIRPFPTQRQCQNLPFPTPTRDHLPTYFLFVDLANLSHHLAPCLYKISQPRSSAVASHESQKYWRKWPIGTCKAEITQVIGATEANVCSNIAYTPATACQNVTIRICISSVRRPSNTLWVWEARCVITAVSQNTLQTPQKDIPHSRGIGSIGY